MQPAILLPKQRIQSIDILRGIVMLIMAIDHARDFFHVTAMTANPLDLNTTTPVLFFTRWITHFCAPAFVFLSGTSAFLAGRRKTKKELSGFLIKRGLWLIFIEVTVMSLIFSFNPFYNIIVLQVIWVIGWSMIFLGLLVRTSIKFIIIIGFILVLGHNVLDYIALPKEGMAHILWSVLFTAFGTVIPYAPSRIILDLYAILPWTGVLFLGYGFGILYQNTDAVKRRKIILSIGFGTIIFFIMLRFINQYGDVSHWSVQPRGAFYTFLSFINTSKYPPSLCYITMTLGPAIVMLSLVETVQDKIVNILSMYGRVPFFYYVLHFLLIHIICVILFFATGHTSKEIADPNSLFLFRPQNFGFSLAIVYVLWALVIIILYKPCKWFDAYRKTHTQWWLSYL